MARQISGRPEEPNGDGQVIRFRRSDWGDYAYAAIRVCTYWYVTQGKLARVSQKPWDEFLDWLGEENWPSLELME